MVGSGEWGWLSFHSPLPLQTATYMFFRGSAVGGNIPFSRM